MIKIKVKLVGYFKTGRFRQEEFSYPHGTEVQRIVVDLRLPLHHLGIVLINGVHANIDAVLTEGDELVLLPSLGGG
jgi:molybdopterin converting factor small subunit